MKKKISIASNKLPTNSSHKKRAVFLDRDGTINYDYGYTHKFSEIKFLVNCIFFVLDTGNKKFVILDIPLLMENKINKKNDILIFVDAKKKEINKRLKKKLNFNPKILKKFKKLQLPVEYKKKQSNFVIKNNFRNNSIKENVKQVLEKIL